MTKTCLHCQHEVSSPANNFCSLSCSTTFNNKLRPLKPRNACLNCSQTVSHRENIFCSKSCAATFNNKNRHPKQRNSCLGCGKSLPQNRARNGVHFCSLECFHTNNKTNNKDDKSNFQQCGYCEGVIFRNNNTRFCSQDCRDKKKENDLKLWQQGQDVGYSHDTLRRILRLVDGEQCSECKRKTWNKKPITLEVEHKDGNSENHLRHNVCLLCPNCHSQTSTYKSKNVGKGRHWRVVRRKEGKSY